MIGYQPRNRWQAFGTHLLISLGIFLSMVSIIVWYWYPGILFTTEGGWQGVRLIASIDFVIGPTLTLLVYKPGKKGLKFDLTVIALLQCLCVTYGMYVVNYSRPAVVAYAEGTFYTVPLLRYDSRNIDITQSPYFEQHLPVWVNIRLPEKKEERLRLKLDRLWKGLETSIDLYEPYTKALPLLAHDGWNLEQAQQHQLAPPASLDFQNVRIFRLVTRYNNYAVAVDLRSGQFTEVIGVLPKIDDPTAPPAPAPAPK